MEHSEEVEGRGRTARKREAKAVEQLALRLAELPEAELAALPKDPELDREIALLRGTSGHSSRRRQVKHLAGLLRRDDELREKIAGALDRQAVNRRQETLAFHHLEQLRDRLCTAANLASALAEARAVFPGIDDGKLSRLARAVHEHGDKRAAREIFRMLRQAEEARDA
jgi:ribosome-associated protein